MGLILRNILTIIIFSTFVNAQTTLLGTNWLDTYDLDGDYVNDHIYFSYTGGGHCCYKINIVLSVDKKERKFPFEIDGGYINGIDKSNPKQFDIKDIDKDGLPEILLRINSYNNIDFELQRKWQKEYGIKTNYIIIEFLNGDLKLRDFEE